MATPCSCLGGLWYTYIFYGVEYVNVCVSRRLKEELAWAIDKWLRVVSNKMLFSYTTKKLKKKAVLNLKQHCMRYYVTLSNIF